MQKHYMIYSSTQKQIAIFLKKKDAIDEALRLAAQASGVVYYVYELIDAYSAVCEARAIPVT